MNFSYDNIHDDDIDDSPVVVSNLVNANNRKGEPMVNNPMKRASVIERITQKRASMVSL